MKFKNCACLAVFGLLLMSLCILQPIQAYTAEEGFAYTGEGKFFGGYTSTIFIDSPINTTYTTNQVSLNFSVRAFVMGGRIDTAMSYSIDGGDNVTVSTISTFVPVESTITDADGIKTTGVSAFWSYYNISGSVELTDLQSGQHSLTVFGNYTRQSEPDVTGFAMKTVYFTINDGNSSIISNIDIDEVVPESEPSTILLYTSAGVLSLIIVVSFVLFTKLRQKDKIKITHT